MGKELLTDLSTRPKMEMNEPNNYLTILGGVSRGFWSPLEDLGAGSAIFLHLKTALLAKLQWHLWVYKFETCFLGSPNHPETALRTTKKMQFFWSRLNGKGKTQAIIRILNWIAG